MGRLLCFILFLLRIGTAEAVESGYANVSIGNGPKYEILGFTSIDVMQFYHAPSGTLPGGSGLGRRYYY